MDTAVPRVDLSSAPFDVITKLLESMSHRDRFTCALVCKAWAEAATAATHSIVLGPCSALSQALFSPVPPGAGSQLLAGLAGESWEPSGGPATTRVRRCSPDCTALCTAAGPAAAQFCCGCHGYAWQGVERHCCSYQAHVCIALIRPDSFSAGRRGVSTGSIARPAASHLARCLLQRSGGAV